MVVALAMVAGGGLARAVALGLAMLGLQFSIGAVNDLFDEDTDRRTKPDKPIPTGAIGRRTTGVLTLVSGAGGLLISGVFGPPVLALALGMYGAGLVYDALLKPTPWGWVAYAVAFPLLPLYAWMGAGAGMPPRAELLLPVAALAGPTLALANGIVDLERDRAVGLSGPAVVMGRARTLGALTALQLVVFTIAWGSLVSAATADGTLALGLVAVATAFVVVGLRWSASPAPARRERGWEAQAVAIALLGTGWLVASLGMA
jgi:4-hydroxybenzoate polyprenyltransferase